MLETLIHCILMQFFIINFLCNVTKLFTVQVQQTTHKDGNPKEKEAQDKRGQKTNYLVLGTERTLIATNGATY